MILYSIYYNILNVIIFDYSIFLYYSILTFHFFPWYIGMLSNTVTVTTVVIAFLVGDPIDLHLPLLLGGGIK